MLTRVSVEGQEKSFDLEARQLFATFSMDLGNLTTKYRHNNVNSLSSGSQASLAVQSVHGISASNASVCCPEKQHRHHFPATSFSQNAFAEK